MILFALLYENSSISYVSLYLCVRAYTTPNIRARVYNYTLDTCKQLCIAHNK